jgi:hypothetical protein
LTSAGLTIRQMEPTNLESPFEKIDSYLIITPAELFYIRSHFPAPDLDLGSYKLQIDGAVRQPLALTLDELLLGRSFRSLYCRSDGVRCRGAAVKNLSHKLSLSLRSVRLIPSHSGTKHLECAGNGESFLSRRFRERSGNLGQ